MLVTSVELRDRIVYIKLLILKLHSINVRLLFNIFYYIYTRFTSRIPLSEDPKVRGMVSLLDS